MKATTGLMLALLALGACDERGGGSADENVAEAPPDPPAPKQAPRTAPQLRVPQDGSPATVAVGREFEIGLDENVTIYPPRVWRLDELPPMLRQVAREFQSGGDAEGAGGTVYYRFVATRPGRGRLRFVTEEGEGEVALDLVAE